VGEFNPKTPLAYAVVQNTRSCSSLLAGYMLLFHQSTMRIIHCVWYVFSTFFDVVA